MKEVDFDKLGQLVDGLRDAWDKLTPEQQAEVSNKVDAALTDAGGEEADKDAPADESEFQRRANVFYIAGGILEVAAVVAAATVAGAPLAIPMSTIGGVFLLLGRFGESIDVQKAKDIGSWLATKHPKAYAIFCKHPNILYGYLYYANKEGPWYMMDSCSIDSEMLTVGPGGLVSAAEIAAGGGASMPDYPSWVETSSYSSSSSSNLLTLGLVAGAAYLILK